MAVTGMLTEVVGRTFAEKKYEMSQMSCEVMKVKNHAASPAGFRGRDSGDSFTVTVTVTVTVG